LWANINRKETTSLHMGHKTVSRWCGGKNIEVILFNITKTTSRWKQSWLYCSTCCYLPASSELHGQDQFRERWGWI